VDYQRHHQKKKNTELNIDNSTERSTDYFDFEQARPIHTASPNELQQDIINGNLLYMLILTFARKLLINFIDFFRRTIFIPKSCIMS
jgi:hypothetical protein